MQKVSLKAWLAGVGSAALLAAVAGGSSFGRAPDFALAKQTRLRAHFDSVERELLARDVSGLDAGRRAARARQIEELRRYRDRGLFPRNHEVPDRNSPIFVDPYGTHCAVGHLIAKSGRSDIVERIARSRNTATIPELAGDTALLAWLDSNGLSVDEAARIQPWYEGEPEPPLVVEPTPSVSRDYAWASAAAAGLGVTGVVVNAGSQRSTARALFGLGSGAFALALGATKLDERGTPQAIGVANAAMGVASIGTALWALVEQGRTPRVIATRPASRVTLAPFVGAASAPGVMLRAEF